MQIETLCSSLSFFPSRVELVWAEQTRIWAVASARRACWFSPLPLAQPPAWVWRLAWPLAHAHCSYGFSSPVAEGTSREREGVFASVFSGACCLWPVSFSPPFSPDWPFHPYHANPCSNTHLPSCTDIFFSCCCVFGETPLEAYSWVPCRNQGMREAWWYHPWKSAGCRQLILWLRVKGDGIGYFLLRTTLLLFLFSCSVTSDSFQPHGLQ